jgi:hypothetical protein
MENWASDKKNGYFLFNTEGEYAIFHRQDVEIDDNLLCPLSNMVMNIYGVIFPSKTMKVPYRIREEDEYLLKVETRRFIMGALYLPEKQENFHLITELAKSQEKGEVGSQFIAEIIATGKIDDVGLYVEKVGFKDIPEAEETIFSTGKSKH